MSNVWGLILTRWTGGCRGRGRCGGGGRGGAVRVPHHRGLCGPTITVAGIRFGDRKRHNYPHHGGSSHGEEREDKSSFGGHVTPRFPGGCVVQTVLARSKRTRFIDAIKSLKFVRHCEFLPFSLSLSHRPSWISRVTASRLFLSTGLLILLTNKTHKYPNCQMRNTNKLTVSFKR